MKKNVLITLSSAACMLVSCGNARLPQISEEQGIEIASNMYKRHLDSSLFQLPDKFVITIDGKSNSELNTPSGHTKSWSNGHMVHNFDLDNLYYKRYQKTTDQNGDSESIYYCFYDNATGILYRAYNENGYKTRTENKMNAESAKSQIKQYRSDLLYYITDDSNLINFESIINQAKELHEKYKSEKDQYYNYFVGSADPKSLQFAMEERIKHNESGDPEYEGYYHDSETVTFKNDLVDSHSLNMNNELRSKDNKFYKISSSNNNCSNSYGGCPIEKPNIGEYILK